MDWSDVKPYIAKFAPMLGGALGGPVGLAAGSIIGNILGVKDAKPEDVVAAIKNGTLTGEQILALKRADQEFALKMKELDINSVQEMEALMVADRKSARDRQVALKDNTPTILSYLCLAVWFVMNSFLMVMAYKSKTIPSDMATLIGRVLGTMDALLGMAFTFFLGANHLDARTREMLFGSTPTDPTTPQQK